jgi:hypothetical protein
MPLAVGAPLRSGRSTNSSHILIELTADMVAGPAFLALDPCDK